MMSLWISTALADTEATVTDLAAEAAAQAEPTWAQTAVEKFAETPMGVWIGVLVVVALGVVLLAAGKTAGKWNARMIAFGALSIALSFVLSCVRLYRMPQGGSVTPGSMLPIMLFSAAYGAGPGALVGLLYGVLQYLQGGWFANVWQFALDYLLAFAALGLVGLFRSDKNPWLLYVGMVVAALGRALSATLAGILFWDTAPLASLIYNGTYLIPDTLICILLAVLIAPRLLREMRRAG